MFRRNLKWDEFIAGEKYRVWRRPDHLEGFICDYIGASGECVWSDKDHGVNMRFDGCKERLIPFECLEEMKPSDNPNVVTQENAKVGGLYSIVTAPNFWAECPELYSELGRVGKLLRVTPNGMGILLMRKFVQRCVPLKNLEPRQLRITPPPIMDLGDDVLIDKVLENPKGFLKIVKGLAKMNKDPRLIAFVERGLI